MEYIAVSKNIKMSPRKVRLIVDEIKRIDIDKALSYLDSMEKRASSPIKKTIKSALANAVNNFKVEKGSLIIREIRVDGGSVYKRYHFAARGRIRPYKKRTSHIKVVLEERGKK